jgi:hypothetical protein
MDQKQDGHGEGTHQRRDVQQSQQERQKHPGDLAARLSEGLAGQNVGPGVTERELAIPTAYDVKELNRALAGDFTDDDLRQIPILPTGTPLEQGATYVDLAASPPEAFKTNAGRHAEAGHYYVPKNRTPYEIWNRLVGRERPTSGTKDETGDK